MIWDRALIHALNNPVTSAAAATPGLIASPDQPQAMSIPAGRTRMIADDRRIAILLRYGAFQRRRDGKWRFGTKVIADHIVERLIAAGVATKCGERVERAGQRADVASDRR